MQKEKFLVDNQKEQRSPLSSEERYELIAMTAMHIEESRICQEDESQKIWDSNDISVNFENMISNFN